MFAGSEIMPHPRYDAETAASSIRQRRDATLGLAVGAREEADTLTAAVASGAGVSRRDFRFPRDTARLPRLAAYIALTMVRQCLSSDR